LPPSRGDHTHAPCDDHGPVLPTGDLGARYLPVGLGKRPRRRAVGGEPEVRRRQGPRPGRPSGVQVQPGSRAPRRLCSKSLPRLVSAAAARLQGMRRFRRGRRRTSPARRARRKPCGPVEHRPGEVAPAGRVEDQLHFLPLVLTHLVASHEDAAGVVAAAVAFAGGRAAPQQGLAESRCAPPVTDTSAIAASAAGTWPLNQPATRPYQPRAASTSAGQPQCRRSYLVTY
jgi:hypothetical protein